MGVMQSLQAILLGQFNVIGKFNREKDLKELIMYFAKKHNFSVIKNEQIEHATQTIPFPMGEPFIFS